MSALLAVLGLLEFVIRIIVLLVMTACTLSIVLLAWEPEDLAGLLRPTLWGMLEQRIGRP